MLSTDLTSPWKALSGGVFIVAQNPVSEKLQFEEKNSGGGAKNLMGGRWIKQIFSGGGGGEGKWKLQYKRRIYVVIGFPHVVLYHFRLLKVYLTVIHQPRSQQAYSIGVIDSKWYIEKV